MSHGRYLKTAALGIAALSLSTSLARADFVINDDLIVDGSACIGFDCVNGESFGFDTLRLKENNLRIKFDDTSVAASFPRNDWQLTVNDSANGGQSKFSIDDISGNRTPFTIEANARSHSLYIDAGGRLGLRTSTPSVEIYTVDGDTPTLRLQQDGSSGFAPQTWDVAGNETNFFVRDVTNGSQLPFRIRPDAPTSSIFIDTDGDVGLGTSSPDAALHIARSGAVFIGLEDTSVAAGDNTGRIWNIQNVGGEFRVTTAPGGAAEVELSMDAAGDLTITGGLITTGGGGTCTLADPCDAVFDPSVYTVPSIEEHAAFMWQNKHLPAVGPTGPDAPINMTEKILTMLNELEHAHIYIEQLNARIKALEEKLDARDG